tara:strand:- start:2553 stop:4550 length:1998 start_codon:yes stop_codon:yes gene_type:complete
VARSTIELIVNASKAINPLKRVTAATTKLDGATKGMNQRLGSSKRRFEAQGKSAKKAAGDIQGLTGAVKGFVTAAALAGAAKFVFANTAELEKQTRSLQVLTGSLDTAKGIISELQDFGAVTPFTSTELIDTAKRLKAFGVETTKLVDITKRLGDVAGATGADLGGITTAFGQIQAKGKLQTEELLQLQERGVDLAGVLKKEYNLTGEEFSEALQKGQISAEAAEFALKKLTDTGGMYADGAISQSDTLSGKLSTLVDNVQRIAQALGALLAPMLKKIFDLTNNALTQINDLMFAMTNPGAASARKAIQGGRLPFNVQGAAELFEGTGVGGRGLKGMQETSTQLAKMGGNRRDILLRLMQDRLAEMDAVNIPQVDTTVPTLPPLNTGDPKDTAKTKKLREQKDLTVEMNALLEMQQALRFSTDEIAKSRIAREIEFQRIIEAQLLPMQEARAIEKAENDHLENVAAIMSKKINQAAKLNKVNLDGMRAIFEQGEMIDMQIEKQAEKMKSLYKSIGDTISSGIVDSLSSAVEGTKSLAEVASDTLKSLSKILLRFGVQSLLGGLGGGNPGSIFTKLFGGGRASGGTVTGGRSFLVGERGPELFTPGRTGSIAPNSALGGANVTVNVDASGSSVEGDSDQAGQLGKMLGAAVQAELIKQKRPGGLLA